MFRGESTKCCVAMSILNAASVILPSIEIYRYVLSRLHSARYESGVAKPCSCDVAKYIGDHLAAIVRRDVFIILTVCGIERRRIRLCRVHKYGQSVGASKRRILWRWEYGACRQPDRRLKSWMSRTQQGRLRPSPRREGAGQEKRPA